MSLSMVGVHEFPEIPIYWNDINSTFETAEFISRSSLNSPSDMISMELTFGDWWKDGHRDVIVTESFELDSTHVKLYNNIDFEGSKWDLQPPDSGLSVRESVEPNSRRPHQ